MRKKHVLWVASILLVLILAACGTASAPEPEEEPVQGGEDHPYKAGMIVSKETNDIGQRLLVYPSEEPVAWEDQSVEEWISKAQEENADISWYTVEGDHYDQLEVGQHVRMTIKPEQMESYPPIRFVIDLEVTPST
ncbi:DUF3221 domain-containing protein [Paenibacillus daejeonensis]|uniref:DUF3221 domain-containing protein n=1 Tax=Paenibacillus daejeonensis TaxID=135193 RepID=UPI0003759BD6|nr:DUF3221 domain-containing protein [Paenibacillus daejeonensis]